MLGRLQAPWRFKYITTVDENAGAGCFFVELPKQTEDRKNLILYRGKTAFVMLNAFPYTSGHLMIAPYKHTADLSELDNEELLEINQLLADCTRWLKAAYAPSGFNIGVNIGAAAGAGVPTHIHWHIVPRWAGDTNFMTVVGEVRVIPQDLFDSYDKLLEIINGETR